MKSLLIVSFSPIFSDARVLKQVAEFCVDHRVTTCGYGQAPPGVAEHIRIPDGVRSDDLNGRLITARLYRQAYGRLSAVAWARAHLRPGSWDVIIANDVETVPLALSLRATDGVHADLHEYSPRLHEESRAWRRRIAPFVRWLCRRYVARANSWTTVGEGLAAEYQRVFGFAPRVVTNAAPFVDAGPTPVHDPIRLVHSGACLRNRNLLETVRGVQATGANVTLDLYLTPNDPAYLEELRRAAAEVPGRVVVNDPVPYADLITTLQGFDLGVHVLAPTNFNNRWALPNKLFDYVQARLGVLVGPSPEMAANVDRHGLGLVAAGFTRDDVASALAELTADAVTEYKAAADRAAMELSAGAQVAVWRDAVESLERR